MAAKDQDNLITAVADNIRRLRKEARMTQTELADAAGISRASVAQIEGQRYSSFTLATLEGIARALSVSADELLRRQRGPLPVTVQRFGKSPWAAALNPTDGDLALLGSVISLLGSSASLPPAMVAELLQLLRRLQNGAAGTE